MSTARHVTTLFTLSVLAAVGCSSSEVAQTDTDVPEIAPGTLQTQARAKIDLVGTPDLVVR